MRSRSIGLSWCRLAIFATLTVLQSQIGFAQPYTYQLRDLGTLGGGSSVPSGISASGTVVGASLLAGDFEARGFSTVFADGPMTDLDTLGGSNSAAFAVNGSGVTVGEAQDVLGDTRAVRWMDDVPFDLGTLEGDVSSSAKGINDSGNIVGVSMDLFAGERAFLYDGVSLLDLGSLGGNTAAYGINEEGLIVGYSFDATATRRAFLWQAGIMTDLLGGAAIGDSSARGIAGDFVYGQYTDDLGDTRAFRYTLSTSLFTDLGSLGGNLVTALAGNAPGYAVGTALNGVGEERAFLYDPATGMWNLNHLLVSNPDGVLLTAARGINDAGVIVAVGLLPSGERHAFSLTQAAAPEASSLALILLIAPLYFRWSRSNENNV